MKTLILQEYEKLVELNTVKHLSCTYYVLMLHTLNPKFVLKVEGIYIRRL